MATEMNAIQGITYDGLIDETVQMDKLSPIRERMNTVMTKVARIDGDVDLMEKLLERILAVDDGLTTAGPPSPPPEDSPVDGRSQFVREFDDMIAEISRITYRFERILGNVEL